MFGRSLCRQCRECLGEYSAEIAHEEELISLTFPHHADIHSLQKSVHVKCPVCILLLRQIQPILQSERAFDPDASPSTHLTVQPSYRFPTDGAFNIVAYANGKHVQFRESLVDFELIKSEGRLCKWLARVSISAETCKRHSQLPLLHDPQLFRLDQFTRGLEFRVAVA